jgi:lysophospholipase L1-like esterase
MIGRRAAWSAAGLLTIVGFALGAIAVHRHLEPAEPPPVYVAVGASESVGVGAAEPALDAWPQVLRRTALPRRTRFTDVAVSGASVPDAIANQLPRAISLKPSIVTVWLNVNDIRALELPGNYEKSLRTLVHGLRRGGATKVYVANTPPVEALPVVKRIGVPTGIVQAIVDEYNDAIRDVCATEGAELVDLHAAGVKAIADGTFPSLVSADGFHPSTAGHAMVASTFAAAIRLSENSHQ